LGGGDADVVAVGVGDDGDADEAIVVGFLEDGDAGEARVGDEAVDARDREGEFERAGADARPVRRRV